MRMKVACNVQFYVFVIDFLSDAHAIQCPGFCV